MVRNDRNVERRRARCSADQYALNDIDKINVLRLLPTITAIHVLQSANNARARFHLRNSHNEKSAQRRRKHCALAVIRRSPGTRDGQNLISWRWSLPLPIDPVWWGSMHAISSYRGNRYSHKQIEPQTHPQTGPITIHCAAKLSTQCNYYNVMLQHCVVQTSIGRVGGAQDAPASGFYSVAVMVLYHSL